tara:strand:- start:272 stop:592 length:321 start_codon:yes stop_codon:yes gene_type:complete
MKNLLKIKGFDTNPAFYLSIDYIMMTAIDPGTGFDFLKIATNNGLGSDGYSIGLKDKDGNDPVTLEEAQNIQDQLKKCLFAKPGVGIVELQGKFNLWDSAEYTQIV